MSKFGMENLYNFCNTTYMYITGLSE